MAQLGNLLVKGSSRFLNKAYFEDISIAGTSFFSDNISTDGTLNIGANKASNALLYLNKKIAIRGVDSWLRINDTSTNFTSGVYFGSSDVRTDKAFQVGDGGKYFKINSSSLDVNVPSVFSQRTTHNGGLISPTISSNLISFVKNGNTLPKIDGADATAILNELTVLSTLRAKEYELDHVQNLGGTFMVSPSFICTEGSTSVTVSAISGSEVTFVIKDNATLTKTEIATASWVLNSQIKLSGKIGNAILANATGTITKSVDTNNHTITVKVDVGSSTVGNFTVNTTYSDSQVSKLALMMFRNASGYRLGIYLESYNSENKKPVINIFDGSGTDPKVVLGKLDGTPKVNNVSPTGYGLYSDNAFLKGTIIATSGTIGGFTLSTNSIQNGTFGQDGSVMMCLGSNNSVSIGGSGNINGWTFTAGSKFGVTKNGAMYATSGKIGKYTITDSCLTTGGGSGCTGMGGTHAFWAGSDDSSNAPFRVGYNGLLYASSATIAGNITATSGTIGGCSIKNNVLQIANANINSIDAGKITSGTINADRIGSGTITADKIAIGDFTNFANLNEKTASKYGFTTVRDDSALGNPWFQLNTLKRDVPITPNAYEEYNCNGGESFKIEGEVYSTVTGKKYKESTNVETLQIGIGLYGKKENGDAYWLISYFSLAENNGKLNTYVTLDNAVRKFGINIQINGTSDFSGILKVRNIKVTRMTDNSLIVNGSITSNKITTDNITGTNGWINLRSGLFDYGNGKLKWDGKTLTVAGSGTFAGEITAKFGKIGKYTITDSYLITGNNSTCTGIGGNQAFWAGSDSSNDAPFHVSYDGKLYASKVDISGKINATSGKIGKFSIDNLALVTRDTDATCAGLGGSSQAFWAGSLTMDDAPFRVGYDGSFYGSKGKIGGWNIDTDNIYSYLGNNNKTSTIILHSAQSTNAPYITLERNCTFSNDDYSNSKIYIKNEYISFHADIYTQISEEKYSSELTMKPLGNGIYFWKEGSNMDGDFCYKASYNVDYIELYDSSLKNTKQKITAANLDTCHAGLVCRYWNTNTSITTNTDNTTWRYVPTFVTTNDNNIIKSEFFSKVNNNQIKILKKGIYQFFVRIACKSSTAFKRALFSPYVNDNRYASYTDNIYSPVVATYQTLKVYTLELEKNDLVDFRAVSQESVAVQLQINDINIFVLDYEGKYS